MWGAIIGAVTSIGGGIASAIGANRARKIQEQELKQREERQAATYARRINQDYTQRADAQRMLKITRDALKQRAEAAAGRQAVMGLTDSGLAAEREMAENVMADTASQIAAAGEAQKDAIEQQYEQQQAENSKERVNIAAGKAAATGQAVGQMVQGVGQVAGALTGAFGKQPKTSKAATPSIPDVSKAMAPRINAPTTEAKNLMQQWDKDIKVSLGKNVPGYHKV
jgi:hypothetical protein